MISHHPSEQTLLAYATGSLPEALAIVTATHIGQCTLCQGSVATLEATGGAVLNDLAMGRWWPIGIGLQYRPLQAAGSAWGGLVLARPGRALPRHGHSGLELTCILSGSFADDSGEYHAGDLSEPITDHDLPPVVIGMEPCLCIIASEGMRLRGVLGLVQRMIGQ